MKRTTLTVLAAAIGLAFGSAAIANSNMSRSAYEDAKKSIAAEHKAAQAQCDTLAANAKDICQAQAKGKERVAKADLKAKYHPSRHARYEARVTAAEADYAVAMQTCDDKSGNDKDVCVKEAKAALVTAKADAKVYLKTADANVAAQHKTAKARAGASKEIAEVRKDAREDKRDADYAVAKEKCDALSGAAKDSCVSLAKSQHGKS